MLTSETKRRIDACRDVLVGKLPLPTDQVELITLALIYKFMDDLDEQSVQMGGRRSFFTGELEQYRWRNLLPQTISAEQRVALFSGGLEAMSDATRAAHLPLLFRDIFRNAFLKFRDGRILTLFLTEINGFTYSHSEELGNAFEYLLQCMGIQGENGQFRTPRHIIDFIVACLDPKPKDKILDPACGTGGFLVSAYKHILAKHTSAGALMAGDLLKHADRQSVYSNLSGYDITDLMVKLSKVNLFLHGFPSPAIHDYDTLSNDSRWNEKADLILANPPFMTPKGGVTPHTKFRIHAKKAEVLFTDYIAEHLTSDGRAGIIVPNGIVATTQTAYVKLRRFLVEDSLVAVVSLPSGVFKPYSGVKTSILLLDKKLAHERDEVLFVKVMSDGFDLGDKRTEIAANDLPEARRIVDAWIRGNPLNDEQILLPSKQIPKSYLLANQAVSLQAETLLNVAQENASSHPIVRLGDVCETTSGGTPLKSQSQYYENGTIPWIRSGELAQGLIYTAEERITQRGLESSSAKIFPVDTVLVAMYGATAGEVGLLKIPATTNQAVCGILPNERFDPAFLYYCLRARKAEMKLLAGGGAQPNISQQIIRNLEIPLPPIEEQQSVVAEIGAYQKVLDGARQIVEGYKPRIDVRPDWKVMSLGDACESIMDGTHFSPKNLPEGAYRYITAKNIKEMRLSLEDVTFVSEEAHREIYRRCPVKLGDVLYIKDGATTGIAAVNPLSEEFSLLSSVAVLRGKDGILNNRFLAYYLNTPAGKRYMIGMVSGVAITRLTLAKLNEATVKLPPIDEQLRIIAELDAEAAQIETVRGLIPAFETKIQRVLDGVWGNGTTE